MFRVIRFEIRDYWEVGIFDVFYSVLVFLINIFVLYLNINVFCGIFRIYRFIYIYYSVCLGFCFSNVYLNILGKIGDILSG